VAARYVVREASGYTAGGRPQLITELLVLDSWHGYEVQWSSQTTLARSKYWKWITAQRWPLTRRRQYAAALAAQLNAEHEAAMLAPMQAATVGEDAQAREGKAR
jgi:hypothetical protein